MKVKILIIILVILSFYGCATKRESLKKETYENKKFLDEIILTDIKRFKAHVKTKISKNDKKLISFSGILLFLNPSEFTIKIHGIFGVTFMKIIFDNGHIYIFFPSKKILYYGTLPIKSILPNKDELKNMQRVIKDTDKEILIYFFKKKSLNPNLIYIYDKNKLYLKRILFYANKKLSYIDIKTQSFDKKWFPCELSIYINKTVINIRLMDIQKFSKIARENFLLPKDIKKVLPLSALRF